MLEWHLALTGSALIATERGAIGNYRFGWPCLAVRFERERSRLLSCLMDFKT